MKILIRADASSAIGTGHVMRCAALAEHFLDCGHSVRFVCAAAPGHLVGLLNERGYDARAIAAEHASPEDNAAATLKAAGAGYDWAIADHYHLDARFEAGLRGIARGILVIDDLADRPHDCDILVDTSHAASEAGLYDALVPDTAQRLVGQDYVLLRKSFLQLRPAPVSGPVRRLLVSFGGNDPRGMTLRALRVLGQPRFAGIAVDVTSSIANPKLGELAAAAARNPAVTLHADTPDFHALLQGCDLCLGAGGMTSWERLYLGKPAVIVTLAENQVGTAARLSADGLVRFLGYADAVSDTALGEGLAAAIADEAWRVRCSRAGMQVVDGRGVARVMAAMEGWR